MTLSGALTRPFGRVPASYATSLLPATIVLPSGLLLGLTLAATWHNGG